LAADESVPESILHYISKQIGISPDALNHYAISRGGETRQEHLRKIRNQFEYRTFTSKEYREIAHLLLPTSMSTNKGIVLVESLLTEMRNRKIIVLGLWSYLGVPPTYLLKSSSSIPSVTPSIIFTHKILS
jgi:hypothetical protein